MSVSLGYEGTMALLAGVLAVIWGADRLVETGGPARRALSPWAVCLLLTGGSFLGLYLLSDHRFVVYNNYSYLAEALLHGHLYVDGMPEYLESVAFGGHVYMHFAPGPALLCLPFVAIWGVGGFNIAWLSLALGAGNTALAYLVVRGLGIGRNERERVWCALLFTFGTVHCFLAALGHGWFLGHVSSWFFLLLAMALAVRPKATGDAGDFLAGMSFGLAVTCRMPNLLGALFFLGYYLLRREKGTRLRALVLFGAGAAIPGGLYMAYDYVRFGTIMDKGYNLTHLKDMHRELYLQLQTLPKEEQLAFLRAAEREVGGPLQLKSVPYNLYTTFLMMPAFTRDYPYVIPTLAGVSLSCLSPALYFAVGAPYRKDKLPWVLLLTAAVCAVPFMMNYGNGYAQFGVRYAMDFLPYVAILAAMGLTRRPLKGGKAAILCWCMLLNMWGPVYWHWFYS